MSAIVNSQNVTFAVGGGDGKFPVSASFVVGGIDNSEVSAMTFQVIRPTQSVTGNSVTIKNEMGNSGNFALIPLTDNAGILSYNSGHIEVSTPFAVSSQTTSTSGLSFYGSTGYNAHYVFLRSNENEGQPMELELPARSETDIFYNAEIGSYDSSDDVGLRIGVKATSSTAEDYISDNSIIFPKTENDNRSYSNYASVFRVRNDTYSPMTVYPAVRTDWHGAFPEGSEYWVDDDSIKTRSYPL